MRRLSGHRPAAEGPGEPTVGLDTSEEIKRLFLEFQAAGAVFFQTLRTEPWGARTFIVKDPDGNLLLFAGPAD